MSELIATPDTSSPELLTVTDLPALKAHLKQTITGPTILGSQLGDLLLRASMAIERRLVLRNFGGLRKFARDHLSDLVSLKAAHAPGQAEIYEVLVEETGKGAMPPIRQPLAFTPRNARYFWYAISNPRSRYAAVVVENKLVCYVRNEIEKDSVIFPSFPISDYRAMASTFAATLPPPTDEKASQVLLRASDDDLHKNWVSFLREDCGVPTIKKWDAVRANEILTKFMSRGEELGISSKDVENYRMMLSAAKSKQSSNTTVKGEKRVAELKKGNELSHVKTIAIEILLRMSDEQIRSLNFPLGLTLDLAQTKNY